MHVYMGLINNFMPGKSQGQTYGDLKTKTYEYNGRLNVDYSFCPERNETKFMHAFPDGFGIIKYKEGHTIRTHIGNIVEIKGIFYKDKPNGSCKCIMDDGKNVYCVWNENTLVSYEYEVNNQ